MSKSIPTHFVSGLQGGYSPNVVEHYDSRGAAIERLRDWKEEQLDFAAVDLDDSRPYVIGSVREGLVQARPGFGMYYDYAIVEDCLDPECESEGDWE
jgi:hypothetical protein